MRKRLINFFSIIFYHVFKIFKIKLFKLNVGRIGHLVELYFLYSLCLQKNKKNKYFCYIYYEDKISNNYLFDKFKDNLNIIPFKIGSFIDRLINNSHLSENKKNTLRLFDFQNKKSGWENYNGEILSIATTNNDELYFENFLKSNNIKYPYVCINLWSFKHLEENYPKVDWSHHKLRMSNDENFIDLINYITTRNFNVIIMGHDNSRFKNLKNKKVFNYSSIRKDILDFFLIKNCYGYISDCTGLDYLAFALKKPMLLNSPFLNYFFNKHQKIVYILKNQYILNKNKQLNLKEMLYEYNTFFKVKSEFYENNKIMLQDNNPLEILEAYKQLESLIENDRCENRIKNYSESFWSEYKKFLDDKKYREKNHYDSGPYPIIYDNIKLD
jgi:putative glycosyltransferase (TIGR04372 family)